jgi:hypothetical protein
MDAEYFLSLGEKSKKLKSVIFYLATKSTNGHKIFFSLRDNCGNSNILYRSGFKIFNRVQGQGKL